MGQLFCENTLEGGWWYPLLESPPGVFVEECESGERIHPLAESELFDFVLPAMVGWTRIGFEAGREYGAINFKADIRDLHILQLSNWVLGECAPDESYRRWAVEFPITGTNKYARRAFWFQSKYTVPKLNSHGRARKTNEAGTLTTA